MCFHCLMTRICTSMLKTECIGVLFIHKVGLKTKYVTGNVTIGVIDKAPSEGVHMLLGNDLAGGQVDMCPCAKM